MIFEWDATRSSGSLYGVLEAYISSRSCLCITQLKSVDKILGLLHVKIDLLCFNAVSSTLKGNSTDLTGLHKVSLPVFGNVVLCLTKSPWWCHKPCYHSLCVFWWKDVWKRQNSMKSFYAHSEVFWLIQKSVDVLNGVWQGGTDLFLIQFPVTLQ